MGIKFESWFCCTEHKQVAVSQEIHDAFDSGRIELAKMLGFGVASSLNMTRKTTDKSSFVVVIRLESSSSCNIYVNSTFKWCL